MDREIRSSVEVLREPAPPAPEPTYRITLGRRQAIGLRDFLGAINKVQGERIFGDSMFTEYCDLDDALGREEEPGEFDLAEALGLAGPYQIEVSHGGNAPRRLTDDTDPSTGFIYYANGVPLSFATEKEAGEFLEQYRTRVPGFVRQDYRFVVVPA